ncbi:MAG TPA: amidase [Candidatus Binatia bacterium]|jgi:aspartyl-tRNA(Asn)/glutamyl-tRNA(Gln) amidotransferase subunit A|nr:amidase [Candidatus Binatia bacterium]
MHELLALTLTELRDRLHGRQASPVELMDAVLARIDETHADLNAVCSRRDPAACRADARAAEARLARGEGRPLEGIPLGVKELEDAEGLPSTEGSLLFRDRVATVDEVNVARLKAAGAIVVGKTNAPEFGAPAFTKNRVYGVTRSPWNLTLTPGGSSGGSSAALAAGVLPIVTATDGGGSIRIPASFVGAFGLKPTLGRVPRSIGAQWEYGDTAVTGPLTKTVADAALLLDQVVGVSPLDPKSLPHPGYSYEAKLAEPPPTGLRLGWSPDLGYAVVQSDIAALVEGGVRTLEKLGHTIVPVTDGPPEAGRTWGLLNAFLGLARLHDELPGKEDLVGRGLMAGFRTGAEMNPAHWAAQATLRAQLNAWSADVFSRVDLLITPTVPIDPFAAPGPYPTVTEGRPQPWSNVGSFTIPFNLSLQPAATVRVGLSQAGLPAGMQIVGPRHREDLILQVAAAFERERPWHPHWPLHW